MENFPAALKLRDGTAAVLRPLGRTDEIRLHKFRVAVPEEERLFIKRPIFERAMFREWFRHPDFDDSLMLLLLHGQKIIGEATLRQRPGGWKRHVGVLTVLTHPDYRGRDVAKILVTEQIEIARAGFGPLGGGAERRAQDCDPRPGEPRFSLPDAARELRAGHASRAARLHSHGAGIEGGRGIRRDGCIAAGNALPASGGAAIVPAGNLNVRQIRMSVVIREFAVPPL